MHSLPRIIFVAAIAFVSACESRPSSPNKKAFFIEICVEKHEDLDNLANPKIIVASPQHQVRVSVKMTKVADGYCSNPIKLTGYQLIQIAEGLSPNVNRLIIKTFEEVGPGKDPTWKSQFVRLDNKQSFHYLALDNLSLVTTRGVDASRALPFSK